MKKCLNEKALIISTLLIFSIMLFVPHFAFAGTFVDTICNMIAGVIFFFGEATVYLIDKLGGQFDKLLFNYDGSTFQNDLNLMILKSGTVSDQIMSVYRAMQFISACVFITVSLWIVMDFVRTSDDPRHKAVLIDRLKKMVISMFLLTSIPMVVDIMLAINYVISDLFRLMVEDFSATSSAVDYSKSFLTGVFEQLYDNTSGAESLVVALAYLMAGVINVWLVIFYMIRDLAISFLLIMAPFMCCLLPYRTDLLVSWFKEMGSNIFTQSIQGLIFAVNIAIIAGISENTSDLYSEIYALVAFAMFIPMTAQVKKLLGLEGNIGAAKSNAGLGAAVMGLALAGRAVSGVKNQFGDWQDANERIKDLKTERDNLGKSDLTRPLPNYNNNQHIGSRNAGSFGSDAVATMGNLEGGEQLGMAMALSGGSYGGSRSNNINSVNTRGFERNRNTIQGEINAIRKNRFNSVASAVMSGIGTATFSIAGSGLGQLGAFAGGQLGGILGEAGGSIAGAGINSVVSNASEMGEDMLFGRGIRPELSAITNGNRNWSIGNAKYNIGNMKENMSKNINAMKSDMKYSWINTDLMPHDSSEYEALKMQKQARQDEMTGLTGDPLRNTEFYENETDSRMQTQSLIRKGEFAKASRYRLSTSSPMVNKEAIQNVENIVKTDPGHALNTMLYTDKNSSILFAQDQVSGEREVLASYPGNPNLETPTMEDVSFNIEDNALITEAQRLDYRAQATAKAVEKFGTESISNPNNEFYSSAQQLVEKETSDMINNHISRVDSLRKSTGSSSITINGSVEYENVASNVSMPSIGEINIDDISLDAPAPQVQAVNIAEQSEINLSDFDMSMSNIDFDVKAPNIENTALDITKNVSINVPSNINSQSAQNVYTNIEKSKIDIATKQIELLQQQIYTDNLKEGLSQLDGRYSNYNGQFN